VEGGYYAALQEKNIHFSQEIGEAFGFLLILFVKRLLATF